MVKASLWETSSVAAGLKLPSQTRYPAELTAGVVCVLELPLSQIVQSIWAASIVWRLCTVLADGKGGQLPHIYIFVTYLLHRPILTPNRPRGHDMPTSMLIPRRLNPEDQATSRCNRMIGDISVLLAQLHNLDAPCAAGQRRTSWQPAWAHPVGGYGLN